LEEQLLILLHGVFNISISKIFTSMPVVAQAKSFSELARNATNITNPIDASLAASKLIVSY